MQLQHIVRGAYQRPFGAHLFHAAQQELPEALRLLDLSEDRLDDGLAPRVDGSPALVISLRFILSTSVADFGMRPRGLIGAG